MDNGESLWVIWLERRQHNGSITIKKVIQNSICNVFMGKFKYFSIQAHMIPFITTIALYLTRQILFQK